MQRVSMRLRRTECIACHASERKEEEEKNVRERWQGGTRYRCWSWQSPETASLHLHRLRHQQHHRLRWSTIQEDSSSRARKETGEKRLRWEQESWGVSQADEQCACWSVCYVRWSWFHAHRVVGLRHRSRMTPSSELDVQKNKQRRMDDASGVHCGSPG